MATNQIVLRLTIVYVLALAMAPTLRGQAQAEDVAWTSAVGVTVTGNRLSKTAGAGWNAGAISQRVLESGGFVEFTASETTTQRLCGLSKGNTDQNYTDVDFAIYLNGSTVQVYESGSSMGSFGSYAAGDRFRVEAGAGLVRYSRNGTAFYTSTKGPSFPLLVDTSLYTTGATLTNVRTGELAWRGASGLSISETTLTKAGGTGWDAGAVSARAIPYGDGYVEFTATETDKVRAAGLSRGDGGVELGDIDFAFLLGADAGLSVVEGGISRGSVGTYASGTRLRVEVASGVVRYLRDGSVVYTSTLSPVYPVVADTALYDTGATLTDVVVSPLMWTNAVGVAVSGNSVRKTGGAGWNAGAVSTTSLSGDGYVEFTALETTAGRACGLSVGDTDASVGDIDFAFVLSSSGQLDVVEGGTSRGPFGSYAMGDRLRVEVRAGVVRYLRNGALVYTGTVTPGSPLIVDTALDDNGATLEDVVVGDLVWKNDVGVGVYGARLVKSGTVTGWNAGAATTQALGSGDGYVEFTASETTTLRMLGLSNGDSGQSYTDIDFAFYLNGSTLQVYESGTSRGSFGTWAPGDRLRVEVAGGVVRYKRNGGVIYTSSTTPTYPLLVDTALYSASSASLAEVTLQPSGGQVTTPSSSPAAGTYTTPQSVALATTTAGATIHYTTDGSEPSESSATYTGALVVGTTTTLRARAYKSGVLPSDTLTAVYQMNFGTLPTPTATPGTGTYESQVSVTLEATAGATIRYTTDGTAPTTSSPIYTAPLTFTTTTTLKAQALHPDYAASAVLTRVYTIAVAAPVFDKAPGTYAAGELVSVTCSTPGATIHYTLNGATPTTSDPAIVSGDTLVVGNYTLAALAVKSGATASGVTSATYSVSGAVVVGDLAAGGQHSVAGSSDGTVWAWGSNTYGQLGDGSTTARSTPGRVAALTGIAQVAAGAHHNVARTIAGDVWSWGYNSSGQVGDGQTTSRKLPYKVALGGTPAVSVAAGELHTVAALQDGSVRAWGDNSTGQLGNGGTTPSSTPVVVSGLSNAVAVAAGYDFTLALGSDGRVWAWGNNTSGQLGDGSGVAQLTPVPVEGLTSIVSIAAGKWHALALRSDGALWAWGSNNFGQLGDGTQQNRFVPVPVRTLSGVVHVAAGVMHSVVVSASGRLWAWGLNTSGEVGDTTTASARLLPVALGPPLDGADVGVGPSASHSFAMTADRSVWGWGANGSSRIGDGTLITRRAPVRLSGPGFAWNVATPVLSLADGTYTLDQTVTLTCATAGASVRYTTDGTDPDTGSTLYTGPVPISATTTLKARAFNGTQPDSNVAVGTYEMKVALPTLSPAGGSFTSAPSVTMSTLTAGATLRYTLDGSDPDLTSAIYTAPVVISATATVKARGWRSGWTTSDARSGVYTLTLGTAAAPSLSPAPGTYADQVSVILSGPAGATLRYTTDGTDPSASSTVYAAPIVLSTTTTLKARSFDPSYTMSAVTTAVYEVQVSSPVFDPAPGGYGVGQSASVTGPAGSSVRYTVDGADPSASDPVLPPGGVQLVASTLLKARAFRAGCTPSAVASASYTLSGGVAVGQVAAGNTHAVALLPSGEVWGWGQNNYGQLGDGGYATRTLPVALSGLPSGAVGVDASDHTLLAVGASGARAWGRNNTGQLGDTSTTTRNTPVSVSDASGLTSVSGLASGGLHSVAVDASGVVWAWGSNTNGQLGDGTTTQRTSPVQVSGLTGGVAVSAGLYHSLALKSDGTVWAWGSNTNGQLGDGTTTQRTSPVQVSGLSSVVAVSAGLYHSLALKSDGTVWAWGNNTYGQLGDGTTTQHTSPVQVSLLSGVRRVSAGAYHNLVARHDGSVLSWGANFFGGLGDGGGTQRNTPVQVVGLVGAAEVDAGADFSLAVDWQGQVWAWGKNGFGELGQGTQGGQSNVPVRVSDPTYAWRVATPVMNPAAGTYGSEQTVTLTSATPGATIHYTTDGATPTASDPSVASGGSVVVDRTLTLKAVAMKAGLPDSNVASGAYTLALPAPTISLPGSTYTTPQSVTCGAGVAGASAHYTLDGATPSQADAVCGAPIAIGVTTTIVVKAWKDGWTTSPTAPATYTMKVATPGFTPASGTYSGPTSVVLSCATPGAVLHYSLDGQEPTTASAWVSAGGSVSVGASAQLMVKGYKDGWTTSDLASATYEVSAGGVATPTIDPPAGSYAAGLAVTITSATPGAVVRYTLDGSDPTWRSRLYAGALLVDWSATVKARAFKTGWTPSPSASAAYTLASTSVAPVEFSPPAGRYTTTRDVTLTTATPGAVIHYTTNGLEPTPSDPSVASGGTVSVDRELVLKARAFAPGYPTTPEPSPVRVAEYHITGAVAAGYAHVVALKSDGSVWSWGQNNYGQLGLGHTTSVDTPTQVSGLSGVVSVAAYGWEYSNTSFAVKSDGTLWGWGSNGSGQLGDGTTTTPRTSPVQVATATGLSNVVAVAPGQSHTLALTASGTVWAWGQNNKGQLGDGTTTNRLTPVPVVGLTDVVAIAAGDDHSVALKNDGTVWSWGDATWGQHGDGTTSTSGRTTPGVVPNLSSVIAVSARADRTLALRSEGAGGAKLWGWGSGSGYIAYSSIPGLLCDGTGSTRTLPLNTLDDVVSVDAGVGQTLVLRRAGVGQASAWGCGYHYASNLDPDTSDVLSAWPLRLVDGDFIALAAGRLVSVLERRDTSLVVWWYAAGDRRGDGFALGSAGTTASDDPDADGLTTAQEWELGTDPDNADTNGDGIPDGVALATGISPTHPDQDGDGVENAVERARGTDPFAWDTDGDGHGDGEDAFPLDPTRWEAPAPTPGDTTPPVITLDEPTNALLITSVP